MTFLEVFKIIAIVWGGCMAWVFIGIYLIYKLCPLFYAIDALQGLFAIIFWPVVLINRNRY